MAITTRHGACALSIDELRALFGVRSTRQALRHHQRCEDLLAVLSREQAEAAAAGKKVRADQVLDSIRRAMRRLDAALADGGFADHALVLIRREFDAAAERAMARAGKRLAPTGARQHRADSRPASDAPARRRKHA